MAELVLGTLGVVPLIGLAIKSYKELNHKIKAIRHAGSIVHRVQKKLRVQYRVFENECQLLLRDCLTDDNVVLAMLHDLDHRHWGSSSIDRSAQTTLNKNYEACVGLVKDTIEAIESLQGELDLFGKSKVKYKGEGIKESWKHAEAGLRVSFSKQKYEQGIAELRDANNDLKSLREQISQLQRPPQKISLSKRPAIENSGWMDIGSASRALHEALVNAWSCGQSSHIRHFVKLFLDAEKAGEDVQMKIAILCHRMGLVSNQTDLVLLQVKSKQMVCTYRSQIPQSLGASQPDERPRKLKKVVRFDHTVAAPVAIAGRGDGVTRNEVTDVSSDLLKSGDFCTELAHGYGRKSSSTSIQCLGHLDVESGETYRHHFYAATEYNGWSRSTADLQAKSLTRMDSILDDLTKYNFSTVDRLKMARSLVSAVLNFHATPWMGESWRLQDLSFFHETNDISRSLRTLHLDIEVQQKEKESAEARLSSEDVSMSTLPENDISQLDEVARITYGINNISLHCLGVALLQIDHCQKLDPANVVGARKLARLNSLMGPQYQEITNKCLRCDFGYGTDLKKSQLQKAVYETVVWTLESMISTLDIDYD